MEHRFVRWRMLMGARLACYLSLLAVLIGCGCVSGRRGLLEHPAPAKVTAAGPPWPREGHKGKLLGSFNCEQVAFYKTHKTGSTTLGSILYRVGAVRQKTFYYQTGTKHHIQANFNAPRADWFLNHTPKRYPDFLPLYDALADNPGKITIFREPVARFISNFNFEVKPLRPRANIDNFKDFNLQAREMGVSNLEEFQGLRNKTYWKETVFLLLEHLDEGLAALHLHCGWPLKDLMYTPQLCASCGDFARFDGRPVSKPQPVTEEQRARFRENNFLDQLVVDAASEKWEDVRRRGGATLYVTTLELKRQQKLITEYCKSRIRRLADYSDYPGCMWLGMYDLEYQSTVSRDGVVYGKNTVRPKQRLLPPVTVQQMVDGYSQMYDELMATFVMPSSQYNGSSLKSLELPRGSEDRRHIRVKSRPMQVPT